MHLSSRLRHHWVTPPSSIYDGCRAVRGSSQSDRRDLLSIVGVGDLQSWTMITFCVRRPAVCLFLRRALSIAGK